MVQALAVGIDQLQQEDRRRVGEYERASEAYLKAFSKLDRDALELPESHEPLCELADHLLPKTVGSEEE